MLARVRREQQSQDIPVPVSLGVFVKRSKHYRQNNFNIVTDKIAEVLIVPEI